MAHRLSFIVLCAPLTLLAGCPQQKATVMLVDVVGKDGVVSLPETVTARRTRSVTNFEATFSNATDHIPQVLSKGGSSIDLPTSFVLRADGRTGLMEIDLKAKDDNQVLGEGTATGTLVTDQQGEISVVLYPDDFGLNSTTKGAQFFSSAGDFGLGARQVGSAGDGSFVAVWEDSCGDPGKIRCDIWYRMFDRTGDVAHGTAHDEGHESEQQDQEGDLENEEDDV